MQSRPYLVYAFLIQFAFLCSLNTVCAQTAEDYQDHIFLEKLYNDSSYMRLKKKVVREFVHAQPGRWGGFVNGVSEDLKTTEKLIAFTFDACGGEKGTGLDKELIEFLRQEKVPATLFVTGKWIDGHFTDFLNLTRDPLFEIENHGINHKPCSINGESEYGIHGTANAAEAYDEIEANARKIEAITGHRPRFYRSATAFIDEAYARLAHELGIQAISFQVLSGDAVPRTQVSVIEENVVRNVRPGAIVIMHLNHPEWNTCEAMRLIVPRLRKAGYRFVNLNGFELIGRNGRK